MNNLQTSTEAATQTKEQEVQGIAKRLSDIETALQTMKGLYEEKDRLTAQLMELVGPNTEVIYGDRIFKVIDNFASKNVVFRMAAVRRYELQVDSVFLTEKKKKGADGSDLQ